MAIPARSSKQTLILPDTDVGNTLLLDFKCSPQGQQLIVLIQREAVDFVVSSSRNPNCTRKTNNKRSPSSFCRHLRLRCPVTDKILTMPGISYCTCRKGDREIAYTLTLSLNSACDTLAMHTFVTAVRSCVVTRTTCEWVAWTDASGWALSVDVHSVRSF